MAKYYEAREAAEAALKELVGWPLAHVEQQAEPDLDGSQPWYIHLNQGGHRGRSQEIPLIEGSDGSAEGQI